MSPTKTIFQGSGCSPELGFLLIQSVPVTPQMSPSREKGKKQSTYQKAPPGMGLEVPSIGARKRLSRDVILKERW